MVARIAAAVLLLVVLAPPAAAQVLRGTALDTTSEKPVVGVTVIAFSAAGARMGDALTNTELGYATTITEIITPDSVSETDVLLPMVRRPVALDTITVVATPVPVAQRQVPWLAEAGFYRRQRWAFGHFLNRADIDKREALVLADLLKGIPGI